MNASLRNCPECGRVFGYMGRNLCPDCLDKEEKIFQLVRKYVRDHPGDDIYEVAEAIGVEEEKILQFLRDGRLQSRGFQASLECERCGGRINSGRYCQSCREILDNSLRRVAPERRTTAEAKPAPANKKRVHKMHIMDSE
ncbi:MAG: MerR family transcriptional regulator [Syntrophomonas sp.]|nr:MerR family transcriptional regulator [Syntrophomonas sp.]